MKAKAKEPNAPDRDEIERALFALSEHMHAHTDKNSARLLIVERRLGIRNEDKRMNNDDAAMVGLAVGSLLGALCGGLLVWLVLSAE